MAKNILIVDDEPKVGYFLKESVESLGPDYTVSHVRSAEDALTALARTPYDLVVTDLRMPGLTGLDLIGRVRHEQPFLPAILITAYGSDEVAAAARRLQTTHYFTKPFRIEEFLQAVQDSLEQPAQSLARRLERVTQRLQDLRLEVGAQGVALAGMQGRRLAEAGTFEGLEIETLLAIMGRSLTAALAVEPLMREERSSNVVYHEGARFDLYAANVDAVMFVTLAFDRRQGFNRPGVVWLYLKRAIQDMQALLAQGSRPLDAGWVTTR